MSEVMDAADAACGDEFPLTADHRMLLRIRDTLYEGSWEDFIRDLRSRAANKPHVFDVVPASAAVRSTIQSHLTMIEAMSRWETRRGRTLDADESTGDAVNGDYDAAPT